jgi:dGTPase
MMNFLILDAIEETRLRIKDNHIKSLEDVRNCETQLVAFSYPVRHMNTELKRFLMRNMYQHYRVARMAAKATRVIHDLFHAYQSNPAMLPPGPAERLASVEGESKRARVIADYIAGMTDRYALDDHARLFDVHASS